MNNKLTDIDITKSVMEKIDRDNVEMHSRRFFVVRKVLLVMATVISLAVSFLGSLSLAYVIFNDVFTDYQSLLNRTEFIKSLPWFGIIVTSLSIIAVILAFLSISKRSSSFKFSYAFGIWLVLIVGSVGLANNLSPSHTPSLIARTAYFTNKDPIKAHGEVLAVYGNNYYKILVNGEEVDMYLVASDLKVGDKVYVLGEFKANVLYVKAMTVTESAPNKQEDKTSQAAPVGEPKPEEKKVELPKPAPTPSVPPPAPPADPQTPTAPTKSISYSSKSYPEGSSNPDKYIITWTANNFSTVTGWKSLYTAHPATPIYGSSYCQYTSDPGGTSGIAKCQKTDLGVGKFNVRICAYNGGVGSCDIYSGNIVIEFIP